MQNYVDYVYFLKYESNPKVWGNEKNYTNTYVHIRLSLNKDKNDSSFNNADKTWGNYPKTNKSEAERQSQEISSIWGI